MSIMSVQPLDPIAARRKYGPWAAISGASDGTGEGYARELAALGINLVLISRRREALTALGDELADKHGIEYRVMVQDLMDADAGRNILDFTADLDIGLYVSNAGADGTGQAFLESKVDRWLRMVNMNVSNVLTTCHGFGLRMRERGGGGLLIVSSMSALWGVPWLAAYSSTKAFEAMLCEALWVELRPYDIDVLSVLAPGMDTPCFRRNAEGTNYASMGLIPHDAFEVARQSLDWLPHGPLLMFPYNPGSEDMTPMMDERRARTEAMAAIGKSFFPAD